MARLHVIAYLGKSALLVSVRLADMNRSFASTVFAIAVVFSAFTQVSQHPIAPVKVPDSATAVKLAEKTLSKIYGKRQIESERPFSASLSNGVWHIAGTLYCKDEKGDVLIGPCVGGVAMAEIRQSDGRVVRTIHTK